MYVTLCIYSRIWKAYRRKVFAVHLSCGPFQPARRKEFTPARGRSDSAQTESVKVLQGLLRDATLLFDLENTIIYSMHNLRLFVSIDECFMYREQTGFSRRP